MKATKTTILANTLYYYNKANHDGYDTKYTDSSIHN